jgi:polyisoprenoid-binding protein YceI
MLTATQRGIAIVRYVFDKNASRFTVQAFATGMLSAFGHNPTIGIRDFAGDVQFVVDTYEQAALSLSIDTTSFEVLDEMKRDDRAKLQQAMNDDVLDVAHYPTATFVSQQITVQKVSAELLQAKVTGDLTLRGNTQNQSFDARVTLLGAMLRVSGDFTIRQSDYGIKPVSFAGGALRLKDDLKFTFELVARQNDSPASA